MFPRVPHKLHIFGHFLAMISLKPVHIAKVRDLPHSTSKSSQSPANNEVYFGNSRFNFYQVFAFNWGSEQTRSVERKGRISQTKFDPNLSFERPR